MEDFYGDTAGHIIEVEGPIHYQQLAYALERDQFQAARGLRVVHVTNDEALDDLPAVLAKLLAIVRDQGREA